MNGALYVGCAIVTTVALAPAFKLWFAVLTEPVTWAPRLPPLWTFVPLVLFIGVACTLALQRALAGEKPHRGLSAMAFIGASAVIAIRQLGGFAGLATPPPEPAYQHVVDTMKVLEGALAREAKGGAYPDDVGFFETTLEGRTTLWRQGLSPLPYQVVVEEGFGPRIIAREGDRPGTLYYVHDAAGDRYWLTGLVLLGGPTGRYAFLLDSEGGPFVVQRVRTRAIQTP